MKLSSLPTWAVRALACFAGAIVLAMMVGSSSGAQSDFGLGFREHVLNPRVIPFLVIGAVAWLAITYRPVITPYLNRPGVRPLALGTLVLVAAFFLMKWNDAVGDGKFGTVSDAATNTGGLAPLAKAYFGWLWLLTMLLLIVLLALAIIANLKVLGWVVAGVAVVSAVIAYIAHGAVVDYVGGIDHSFGVEAAIIGYLVFALGGGIVALTRRETADSRDYVERVFAYRPGLPILVLGLIMGLITFLAATWFSPQNRNATLTDTRHAFFNSPLAPLAVQYLAWLGYVLFAVTFVLAAGAVLLRQKALGWAAGVVAVVAVILTVFTLHAISSLATDAGSPGSSGTWSNLGAGGWGACIALFVLGAAGVVAAVSGRERGEHEVRSSDAAPVADRLHTAARSTTMRSLALVGIAFALFYPPTATAFWQKALVTDIGVYVLLAVGLNVVIGWAGLLDLGFIAFYAIGSYMTAYLTGSLPVQPPFEPLSPLWAIPFAIAICLVAGVLLGTPTLRLRGDYLAIVTLGFGEIIRLIAVNNPGNFTNGPRGVSKTVPHPVIDLRIPFTDIRLFKIEWGSNALQYWYLLLVLLIIVVTLFYRLEGSRLGRAWAAIREDEIAAQATGVNTTRVKLLAFAIGASTSGLAGVFFASQIGYFNPQNFVLNNSILVVAYVVFGGMGSLPGAMAGAAFLTWLPNFLRDQVPAEDRTMWIGAVLIVMMIFRPQGLIPARRRKAELTGLAGHDDAVRAREQAVPAGEGLGGAPAGGAGR
ncbi:branched-chain amino acid ABC transporter permease [Jatrophihabitans sp. YIM 134969]